MTNGYFRCNNPVHISLDNATLFYSRRARLALRVLINVRALKIALRPILAGPTVGRGRGIPKLQTGFLLLKRLTSKDSPLHCGWYRGLFSHACFFVISAFCAVDVFIFASYVLCVVSYFRGCGYPQHLLIVVSRHIAGSLTLFIRILTFSKFSPRFMIRYSKAASYS